MFNNEDDIARRIFVAKNGGCVTTFHKPSNQSETKSRTHCQTIFLMSTSPVPTLSPYRGWGVLDCLNRDLNAMNVKQL
jgi:hypothetical protein